MTDTNVKQTALAWHEAGYCILPAADDGSKKPGVGSWDAYKNRQPDRASLNRWLARTPDGIGMVCGAVSGNVEMLELEAAAADRLPTFLQAVADAEADYSEPVGTSIMGALGTYMERTPTGGYHFLYRVDGPVAGNTKLASTPREPDETSPARRATLFETRGEGGWTVLAPSGGVTHPSGGVWEILSGRPGVLATITEGQRDLLHAIAASFDEMPPPAPQTVSEQHRGSGQGANSRTPGEDFSERTSWADLLTSHGWRRIYGRGEVSYWQRPGKTDRTISASTGHQGDWLYVFSTSTEFEPERTYTKFGAYALLEHGGNYSAAASELRRRGYGRPVPAAERKLTVVRGEESSSPVVEGNTVRKPQPVTVTVTAGLTDRGNAVLMAAEALRTGELLYAPIHQAFYKWDRNRWLRGTTRDNTPAVELYFDCIDGLAVEGPNADAIAKHKIKSEGGSSTRNAIELFRNDSHVQVDPRDFDADPWVINTPDGVVNLITGELTPSTPAGRHTHLTRVAPDFNKPPARWLAFLAEIFCHSANPLAMIEFMQRLAGYSAVGTVTHHVLAFLHGIGANGKTVMLNVLQDVLGDYASVAPPDFLLARQQPAHETELARLLGKRLVVCSEVSPTARFNEERILNLTGGERVIGHFMGKDHIEFWPSHTLWLMGNHEPRITYGGPAFWRRFRKIPFDYVVPEERRDPELARKLVAAEGPSILAWMIEGARLQRNGLAEPPEVLMATEEYAVSEDQLGRFLSDRIKFGGGDQVRVETKDMRSVYERWCAENGEKVAWVGPRLGRELKARGIKSKPSGGKYWYVDVMFVNGENEPDRPEQTRFGG